MADMVRQIDWPCHEAAREQRQVSSNGDAQVAVTDGSARLMNSKTKRLIDVAGSLLGLVVLLPFLLLVSLFIVAESRGPILFRQRRSGRDGGTFVIYKFRTMRTQEDGDNIVQATRKDARVTFVGRFLRRSSIDELPQLLNVLKGEMSLVGPRPHAVAHDQYYLQMVPSYHLRFKCKPGITGLAQVSGFRGEVEDIPHMQARIDKDLEYIEKWSLALDFRILLLTVTSAPFHRAAY